MATTADDVLMEMASRLPPGKERFRYTGPAQISDFLKKHMDMSIVRDYFSINPLGNSEELEQAISNLSFCELLHSDAHRQEKWFNYEAVLVELQEHWTPMAELKPAYGTELEILTRDFAEEISI